MNVWSRTSSAFNRAMSVTGLGRALANLPVATAALEPEHLASLVRPEARLAVAREILSKREPRVREWVELITSVVGERHRRTKIATALLRENPIAQDALLPLLKRLVSPRWRVQMLLKMLETSGDGEAPKAVERLEMALDRARFGAAKAEHLEEDAPALLDFQYAGRHKLYEHVQTAHFQGEPIDYLEFGVFQGRSFETWLRLNQHQDSRFWGFDSFEGLPEAWGKRPKGHFGTGGGTPVVNDARAAFVKGWFQDTLPGFLATYQPRNRRVIHLDADLYSSTLFVLCSLDPVLDDGTFLFFDEFPGQELRALTNYASAYRRAWKMRAAGPNFTKVAIELFRAS